LLGRKYLCQKKYFRSENLQINFIEEIWLNKEITKVWVNSTVWIKEKAILSSPFIDLKKITWDRGETAIDHVGSKTSFR
jgi:hypothetical protein